ncbi:MAG: hypothetical protein WA899_12050, partial [Candidatus Sulfotelmatobacter sp.]
MIFTLLLTMLLLLAGCGHPKQARVNVPPPPAAAEPSPTEPPAATPPASTVNNNQPLGAERSDKESGAD